jgi:hypothetical protein
MALSSSEARRTLKALERLICVAELMELRNPMQRAALKALRGRGRGRRAALRRLIAARQKLKPQKIICIAAWRDVRRPGASARA